MDISLITLANGQSLTTLAGNVNSNSETIAEAFENVLDRTATDAMQANLDMNSFQILNLPAPSTLSSPARISDVAAGLPITVNETINNFGVGLVANPTASVGLVAVNGVSTNSIRSDGAPALSQAIIPIWTGLHTFTANINLATGNTLNINSIPAVTGITSISSYFFGGNAGNLTASGSSNTGVGSSALHALTSGTFNVAVGSSALSLNTSGGSNVAVGFASLFVNTTGINNTAVGFETLANCTIGSNNIAIGASCLAACTTASNHIAIGPQALFSLQADSGFGAHIAIGNAAMQNYNDPNGVTGIFNTAIGFSSLQSLVTGAGNTGLGFESNLFAGRHDGSQTVSGNTAIGTLALCHNTDGNFNTAVGYFCMDGQGRSDNPTFGSNTGAQNTAVGANALLLIGNSNNNCAFGMNTLSDIVDGGSRNTALGFNTGRGIVTGSNNTILGANVTGLSSSLSNNIIIADSSGNIRAQADSSGTWTLTPAIVAKTKAGAFVAADFPSGTWFVGRDTTNSTTKVYYNNAGSLMSVALT